ncbi:TOMM precursor leader peptide-binding protein [Streptomyces sp. MCA2]|uniref:TOMM precursor leader peptide-binding protein n=1 Tax=Streptomyces TaxID=1883 RepID=UPI0020228C46|nr:TOMM precursor leader peptide-binding protein [Streptomyces sp. MCA2]MCL7495516.1 TOMM precursor leader peptide-binding protein [Streptomyces sp. MCA2]
METTEPFVGFRRHLRAEVVPDEATYLLSGRGVTALFGRPAEVVAPLLDGTRTLSNLLTEAARELPAMQAGAVVAELATAGLIGYRPDPGVPSDGAAAAFWDLAEVSGLRSAPPRLRPTVEILAVGRCAADGLRAACTDSGLTVVGPGPGGGSSPGTADLSLVLCDDYLAPDLAEVDTWHRSQGRPWLPVRPGGAEPWAGPVFRPDAGACWRCLADRLRGHRRGELAVQRALGADRPVAAPEASLAAGRAMGLQLAVLMAATWLGGVRRESHDAICALDTLTLHTRHHTVHRRPQCPGCGDPGLVARTVNRPVEPVSRTKAAHGGGNHRALPPEQMLARHGHLVGPVTGVVSEIRRADNAPAALHCYTSGHNVALGGGLGWLRGGLRSLSGGKGVTAVEAQVSALCEAVERYSGTRQGDEPVIRDSLRALGGDALHPNSCQLWAARQFRDRDRWNATASPLQRVAAPFDAAAPTDWTPVWSLTQRRQRLLPTSLLYFGPAPDGTPPTVPADSNGNAAGSSLEDAIVQGFLELVERDAVAQWWYNRTRHAALDLDAFDEPWIAGLRTAYERDLHREVWALDLTSDFGIPVVAAVSRRRDKAAQDITFGFGAHFDPRLALRRALTEMNQLLPPVLGAREDGTGYLTRDRDLLAWWTGATVGGQPYLLPDGGQTARTPGSYGYRPRADLRDDIEAAERLVAERGLELLVLDQTRPDVGIPVVAVLVPGLRHFWARFAPGRLFDVPVAEGRLARPTRYEDLNPVPLFV